MTRGLKVVAVSAGLWGYTAFIRSLAQCGILQAADSAHRRLWSHRRCNQGNWNDAGAVLSGRIPVFLDSHHSNALSWRWSASGRFRVAVWLSLGLRGLCLILTTSTVGFIGMTMAILAACFVLKGRGGRLIPILVVVAVLVTIPVVYIAARSNLMDKLIVATVDKPTHGSANERTGFVKAAIGMFLDYPIIGVGPGMYDNFARDYALSSAQPEY